MGDQLDLYPTGLTRSQFDRLSEFADRASDAPLADLLTGVQQHVEQTKLVHERNRLVNLRLATAIHEAIAKVAERWDELSAAARNWLAGAFLYFSKCNDDEPDFDSPIGFEDDTEVLNACLRFAKLDDLCLNVEDYDDA